MRRSIALVVVLLLAAACDREIAPPSTPTPTPTPEPAPTPRALLQPVGVHQFTGCINATVDTTCVFVAALVNRGAGCGYHVEGTTRLFDATGLQLGGAYRWQLPAAQIVAADERVSYFVSFVPFAQATRVISYLTDVTWIDTPCR